MIQDNLAVRARKFGAVMLNGAFDFASSQALLKSAAACRPML